MTRLIVLTFWGDERFAEPHSTPSHAEAHGHSGKPHESPNSMLIPLVVLAVGAIVVGFVGVPEILSFGKLENNFEHFIRPAVEEGTLTLDSHKSTGNDVSSPDLHGIELNLMLVSSVIAIVGMGIGWVWFKRKPLWQPPRLLENKYYVDEVYDAAVVQPIKLGSIYALWKFIDVRIIDGAVNGAGELASQFGAGLRHLQAGLARGYVAIVVLGALLLIGYFVMRISS
jgi:NADH-quinone oxidoreductase subunit L